jgi:Mg/Co/Ni transporter MgtE
MLTGAAGKLAGLFTDSDLARLFETRRDQAIDRPIREVMTGHPCTVPQGSMMVDAVTIMAERKISELPVIDRLGRPLGMIDITDVVALFPEATMQPALPQPATPQAGESPATIPVRKTALGSSRAGAPRVASGKQVASGKSRRAKPAIPKSPSRECA